MLRGVTCRPPVLQFRKIQTSRWFAARRGAGYDVDEAELAAARKWLANLDADTIRKNAVCDISFSRSSGPGGQNVNKYISHSFLPSIQHPTEPAPRVSSKATLRIPTTSLLSLLPKLLHPHVLSSRYHAAKTCDLVIQADDSRKQTDNVNACFRKLHNLILQAGREAVPGETSLEQVKRVEDLQKAEKMQRRKMKEFQSKKKSSRRGGGGDD